MRLRKGFEGKSMKKGAVGHPMEKDSATAWKLTDVAVSFQAVGDAGRYA
jgi:hypothetical protein